MHASQSTNPDAAAETAGARKGPSARRVTLGIGLVVLVAAGLAVDATWKAGYLYAAVSIAVTALALSEFASLADRLGVDLPHRGFVLGGTALFAAHWAAYCSGAADAWLTAAAVLAVLMMLLFSVRAAQGRVQGTASGAAFALGGWVYLPLMFGFLTAVRLQWGVAGLITLLAVGKGTSSGAYFAGTLLGRRKLVPAVSPGKTVAGLVGALIAGVLIAWAISHSALSVMDPLVAPLFGLLVAVAATFGDLAESLLKREADIKDSGSLLPGFGGMLDMVDDVIFAAPVGFLFLYFHQMLAAGS